MATLDKIFRSIVHGQNFMTPDVIGHYKASHYICELSTGIGFSGGHLYGVTIADTKTKKHRHDLSKCFYSEDEAKDYINSLSK